MNASGYGLRVGRGVGVGRGVLVRGGEVVPGLLGPPDGDADGAGAKPQILQLKRP